MTRVTRIIWMTQIIFGVLSVPAVQPTHNFSDKTVPELLRLLEDSDASVRHCAAIFIGDRYRNPKKFLINGPIQKPNSPAPEFPIPIQVIPALTAHLKADMDWAARVCSLMALQELRFHTNTTPIVALALDDKDTLMRIRACSALIEISRDFSEPLHTSVVPVLIGCLDPKGEVENIWQGAYAAERLGTNGTTVVPALRTLMAHDSEKVRQYAERALLRIEPASKNFLVLLDVQGLWGGQSLWLREDGTAIVQVVTRPKRGQSGLQARRFTVRFTDSQSEALNRLLQEQSFATIRTPDRAGIPDEACPKIWMRTRAGTTFAAMKFANDKHKAFDSVYDYLLKLVETGKQGQMIYSGPYTWDWRPEGFPSWQEIHNLAVKNSKIHEQVKEK